MAVQPRRNSLTDSYVQAQQIQSGQQQMKMQQMQMDAAESAAARDAEKRNALKTAYGPDGLDYAKAEQALLGAGDPEGAISVRGLKLKEGESKNKAATAEIELGMKRVELEGRILSGARDPQSYEMARQQAVQQGLDVSDWPAEFDAQLVDQAVRATMDPQVRYEMAAKELEAGFNREKFAETQRHNRAVETRAPFTIQMPGQMASRPITPAEAEAYQIPPELAGYMMVDGKGNLTERPLAPGEQKRGDAEQDAQAQAAINSKAYQVWSTAAQGLAAGLQGTRTGPISGRITALTPEAQIGDAAVAATAPALKQLFRTAGEGTFTDRDQQMLLDMVPTRQTHPEARKAILKNIDAIIKSKLGIEDSGTPSAGPKVGDVVDGYQYLGGPPASPSSWKAP
jgi:hypothetical protein